MFGGVAVNKEDGRDGSLTVVGDVKDARRASVEMPMEIVIGFPNPLQMTKIRSEQRLVHRQRGRFINVDILARLLDPSRLLPRQHSRDFIFCILPRPLIQPVTQAKGVMERRAKKGTVRPEIETFILRALPRL